MGVCNTSLAIKYMKRFLILLLFLPFFAFADSSLADGECRIVTYADGTYHIVCEGTGVIYDYVTITNRYVYEVRNCEQIKSQLYSIELGYRSQVGQIAAELTSSKSLVDDIAYSNADISHALYLNGIEYWDPPYTNIETALITQFTQIEHLRGDLDIVDSQVSALSSSLDDITDVRTNIMCCSDSDGDSGSCSSCCDFSEILDLLNSFVPLYVSATNSLTITQNAIFDQLGGYSNLQYRYMSYSGAFGPPFYSRMRYFSSGDTLNPYINLLNLSLQNQFNTAVGLASVNNYLYDIRTNLIVLTTESTNFFSFFRGEIGVKGVLEDWRPQNGTYFEFLTNHYVTAVRDPSSLSPSQSEKTNWFARVETLLAALVFADDSVSTNTVDSAYGNDQVSQLSNSLDSLANTSSTRLSVLNETSQSLLSRVQAFSSGFSDASMPSTVRLVKMDSSDSSYIQFESSEISPLVEACHCATTLAWCLGGLILLFWFIHYTVRASYNLVVFIYSVVSSIFGK